MSLRARLTLLSGMVVVLALVSFTFVTVTRSQEVLERREEEELAALAKGLAGIAERQVARVESGRRPLTYETPRVTDLPDTFEGYATVVLPDRSRLPLPQLTGATPVTIPMPSDVLARAGQGSFDVALPEGGTYRARVVALPGTRAVMFVGLSDAPTIGARDDIARAHLVAGAVLLVTVVLLTAVAVSYGLRPLSSVTATAARIAGGSTDERVPESPPKTEIGRLTSTLNQMLGTIARSASEREQAIAQTERFAADAAHELRTPVTAILGYAELYQHGAVGDEARLDQVFSRIHQEASRLGELVEGLLLLNHLDHDNAALVDPSDATEVCAAAAADSMTIDPDHPITLDAADPPLVQVAHQRLFQIVANLLANVRAHTPPGSETTVSVRAAPARHRGGPGDRLPMVEIEVADDGPGIDGVDANRVFDRFYRADAARERSADGRGVGLGLAIVAALATDAGGDATLVRTGVMGTTFRVTLPAAPDPA